MSRTTMTSLDFDRLRDVVDVAHDTSGSSAMDVTFAVLDRVREMIGGDWASFHDLESGARRIHHLQGTDGVEHFTAGIEDLEDQGADDPFWKYYPSSPCALPDRSNTPMVFAQSEFYSELEWAQHPMNLEDPTDVYDEILAVSPYRPGVNLRLLIGRNEGSRFSDMDTFLVRLLLPHLQALFRRTVSSVVPSVQTLLTERQREIIGLVREGMTNQQVARQLSISPGTVRKHLENSYSRLNVQSRVAAVGAAFPNSEDDLQQV